MLRSQKGQKPLSPPDPYVFGTRLNARRRIRERQNTFPFFYLTIFLMTPNSTAELDHLLSRALTDIAAADDSVTVEQLRVALLGRQGAVTTQLKPVSYTHLTLPTKA